MKLSRKQFLQGSALGAVAALGGSAVASENMFSLSPKQALAEEPETIVWSHCHVNCGGRCVFQWHTKDGKITRMETDNLGEADFQARACLRGRSMRQWINSPDRLMYPMKRVGKRGEGKFERISWDEALDILEEKLKHTIETYGNDAIFTPYGSAQYAVTQTNALYRFLNCIGGYLGTYADYSTHMMQIAIQYLYGKGANPYDDVYASSYSEAHNADLVVQFGNSPAETRMGGANAVWDYTQMREAGPEVINIDYRMSETSSGQSDTWLPIRPGTDAALASAIAYQLITNDQIDIDFLHKYCVGYDEETLPESAKGKNLSYKAYIMGEGYDKVAKTPEWAAPITQIPADKIIELADKIGNSKALFVNQGWGSQRHTNGEWTTLAICMIPILRGMIGKPGTNTGLREASPGSTPVGLMPAGDNPVKATIPVYNWANAVKDGKSMTKDNAGVRGVDKLDNDIKIIIGQTGNCLTNQHGDINYTHDLLVDESKVEFICLVDVMLTDSAKYADLLLPDAMRGEQLSMSTNGYSEYYYGVMVGGPAQEAPGECRPIYDVMAELADRFGVKDKYTEGRTQEEWIEYLYNEGKKKDPELPTWEEIREQGFYKRKFDPCIGLKDFVDDPEANALETPSGKIEIYSETLAEMNDTLELLEGDEIFPIPVFTPGYMGYGSVTEEFPLYGCGFHHKSRTHSSYHLPVLMRAARHQMWMNEIDAKERGIKTGDVCRVKSPAGEIEIEVLVTSRIVPGSVGIPQGAWHDADMDGDKVDKGGCINTLVEYRPTPLAKGNGNHTFICQVRKVQA